MHGQHSTLCATGTVAKPSLQTLHSLPSSKSQCWLLALCSSLSRQRCRVNPHQKHHAPKHSMIGTRSIKPPSQAQQAASCKSSKVNWTRVYSSSAKLLSSAMVSLDAVDAAHAINSSASGHLPSKVRLSTTTAYHQHQCCVAQPRGTRSRMLQHHMAHRRACR